MLHPDSPKSGVTYDLHTLDRELRAEEAYVREGHTARTLVRQPDLRVVLIAIRGGGRIAEHEAEESVSVHTISGALRLRLPDRAVDLPAGSLLALAPGVRHEVEAAVDSAFVLTLGWNEGP